MIDDRDMHWRHARLIVHADVRRLSGFYKGVPKVRYVDAGLPVPTPKYRTDWNVFRNLRLTLYALAVLLGSSQGQQLTRLLTFQSCLESSQSERGHEDYNPSDCQTANEARLEIEYYVHTRMRVPILI